MCRVSGDVFEFVHIPEFDGMIMRTRGKVFVVGMGGHRFDRVIMSLLDMMKGCYLIFQ